MGLAILFEQVEALAEVALSAIPVVSVAGNTSHPIHNPGSALLVAEPLEILEAFLKVSSCQIPLSHVRIDPSKAPSHLGNAEIITLFLKGLQTAVAVLYGPIPIPVLTVGRSQVSQDMGKA